MGSNNTPITFIRYKRVNLPVCIRYAEVCYIGFQFRRFSYNFGRAEENRSLYRENRYKGVRYIRVPLRKTLLSVKSSKSLKALVTASDRRPMPTGRGALIKDSYGEAPPEVQTLNLSYTYLYRSGTPFTYPKQKLNLLYISKISRNSRSSRDFIFAL